MTLFAVACAGMFPLLHMGRPWLFYWLIPYPITMWLWPQFRSPLVWDVFAVSTYATVSLLFWFVGLIPDLATLRDRARNRVAQIVYGILAMGWRGSARALVALRDCFSPAGRSGDAAGGFRAHGCELRFLHRHRARLALHDFPAYFVAGAIYSGFAMVMTLAIPLRKFYDLEDFITMRHLDNMAKVMLATGMIVAYGYMMETFMALYSGNTFDRFMIAEPHDGPVCAVTGR